MNIKIIYFSGTGNTELISQKLKEAFESSETNGGKGIRVDISTVEKSLEIPKFNKDHYDLFGIGFPVYDLLPPEIIMRFVQTLPNQETPVPIFIFSTPALIQGDCFDILGVELQKKGYYIIQQSKFKTPSNGAFVYEKPEHSRYKTVRFETGIDQLIIQTSSIILSAYIKYIENPFSLRMRIKPGYNIFRFFSQRLYGDKYYRNLFISNLCNNCGLCVKLCPDNNLLMVEGKPVIQRNNGCLRCLRCVCGCQQSAISFTSSSLKERYTKEVRDQLYQKAIE